jgi:hypothetical protein
LCEVAGGAGSCRRGWRPRGVELQQLQFGGLETPRGAPAPQRTSDIFRNAPLASVAADGADFEVPFTNNLAEQDRPRESRGSTSRKSSRRRPTRSCDPSPPDRRRACLAPRPMRPLHRQVKHADARLFPRPHSARKSPKQRTTTQGLGVTPLTKNAPIPLKFHNAKLKRSKPPYPSTHAAGAFTTISSAICP